MTESRFQGAPRGGGLASLHHVAAVVTPATLVIAPLFDVLGLQVCKELSFSCWAILDVSPLETRAPLFRRWCLCLFIHLWCLCLFWLFIHGSCVALLDLYVNAMSPQDSSPATTRADFDPRRMAAHVMTTTKRPAILAYDLYIDDVLDGMYMLRNVQTQRMHGRVVLRQPLFMN